MRISVCMAVYNGDKYLRQQLLSILNQSIIPDEIIVVDDSSGDKSLDILNEFKSRLNILILRNEVNTGVIKSFERALKLATGDVIFLCDQDDLWKADKIEVMSRCFKNNKTSLVLTNYRAFNESIKSCDLSDTKNTVPKLGIFHTLIKNNYMGCCMAFRRDMSRIMLPFPNYIDMHDSWIGMIASLIGDVEYINKELIYYRRHEENVTGTRRPIGVIIRTRLLFLISFLTCIVSKRKYIWNYIKAR